jgi:hypothetical protein
MVLVFGVFLDFTWSYAQIPNLASHCIMSKIKVQWHLLTFRNHTFKNVGPNLKYCPDLKIPQF